MITKINNKEKRSLYAKLISLSFIIYSLSFSVACSDRWDEHYSEADVETSTLWQMISSVSELSNFASVAEACGYDRILDGSQTYTVFAPTNLALSEAEARQLIAEYRQQEAQGVRSNENTVVRRFLQNHIALYRHPVS